MFKLVKNILFPKQCFCCKILGSYICKSCQKNLLYLVSDICLYCEKGSFNGLTHESCQVDYGIDRYITIFNYNPTLKKIIANIKYRLVSDAFADLLTLGSIKFTRSKPFNEDTFQLIQPTPLHSNRYKQRGFNQSEIIAKWLMSYQKGRMVNVLERTRSTRTQATLKKNERILNAEGAFSMKQGCTVEKALVLLVDDVVTTGSTVKSAAKVLKKAGASKVTVFSVAKG